MTYVHFIHRNIVNKNVAILIDNRINSDIKFDYIYSN